jgi:hypothetical protein
MQCRSFLHSAVCEWACNLVGETHLFSQTFNQPYRSLFTPHATSGQVLAVGVVRLPSTGCGAEFGPSIRIQSASMQSRVGQAEQEHRPTPAPPRNAQERHSIVDSPHWPDVFECEYRHRRNKRCGVASSPAA